MLEEGAAAGLVEYYCYDGAPKSCYFNNIVNEIYLGAGAELNHYKFQNEACKAAHIAFNAVRIKRNGVYNGFACKRALTSAATKPVCSCWKKRPRRK